VFSRKAAIVELPPDQAKRSLLTNLVTAKAEANRLGATLAASLIGMAILCLGPVITANANDPPAQNDNQVPPDER
jgi:hypothetical protein